MFLVASSATAFAPFSQYSAKKARLASGSGHAQPGQSNPSFWLIFFNRRMPFRIPTSFFICVKAEAIALAPTAECGIFVNSIPVNFSGGCAFTLRAIA